MKTCPRCGHLNKDEAKFCGACGIKFEADARPAPVEHKLADVVCPVCSAVNRADAHFCGQCGAELAKIAEGASAAPLATLPSANGPSDEAPPDAPADAALSEWGAPLAAAEPPQPDSSTGEAAGVAAVEAHPPAPAAAASTAGVTCGHCGTVIRYCPCCGTPLDE